MFERDSMLWPLVAMIVAIALVVWLTGCAQEEASTGSSAYEWTCDDGHQFLGYPRQVTRYECEDGPVFFEAFGCSEIGEALNEWHPDPLDPESPCGGCSIGVPRLIDPVNEIYEATPSCPKT